MENQFVVRSRFMENQFVSPVLCAPDWWRNSLCQLRCALKIVGEPVWSTLKIDKEPVCVTCDVRSSLMENQFVSPVMCARDRSRTSLYVVVCALDIHEELDWCVLQIDGEPVWCALQIDGGKSLMCVPDWWRTSLICAADWWRTTLMWAPDWCRTSLVCAPDWWRPSLLHLWCALQVDREPVCVSCDVRLKFMENKFV